MITQTKTVTTTIPVYKTADKAQFLTSEEAEAHEDTLCKKLAEKMDMRLLVSPNEKWLVFLSPEGKKVYGEWEVMAVDETSVKLQANLDGITQSAILNFAAWNKNNLDQILRVVENSRDGKY